MTWAEFIARCAKAGRETKKDARRRLEDLFLVQMIAAVQRDGRLLVPGFGVFFRRKRRARNIRNPSTNELMRIPANFTLAFRAARAAKSTVDRGARKMVR